MILLETFAYVYRATGILGFQLLVRLWESSEECFHSYVDIGMRCFEVKRLRAFGCVSVAAMQGPSGRDPLGGVP